MIISGWGHFCDIAITISSIQTLLALLFICCKSLNAVFAFIHDISGPELKRFLYKAKLYGKRKLRAVYKFPYLDEF